MEKQSLLGESLKKAFTKQGVLFVVICSAVTFVGNLIPFIGGILSIVFSILFGCYVYNLALQFALKKHFPSVEDPKIIAMSPTYGKKPPVMWCWSLLYGLGLFAIAAVLLWAGSMLASNMEGGGVVVVLILTLVLILVACVVYTWLFMYPQILGTALGDDKEIKKEFIDSLDKKYYLIILLGGVIVGIVALLLAVMLAGGTFTTLMYGAASGKMSSTAALTFITQLATSFAIVVLIASLIASLVNIAAFYYAYSSWLNKADLKRVAIVFGLPTSSAEAPVKEEVSAVAETATSTLTTQSVASEELGELTNTTPQEEIKEPVPQVAQPVVQTPQSVSEPIITPTETPVNSSAFQNQYVEHPVDNSVRQTEPPKTIKINLNANK